MRQFKMISLAVVMCTVAAIALVSLLHASQTVHAARQTLPSPVITSSILCGKPPACGPTWRIVPGANTGVAPTLYGVTAVSSRDVWAVGTYETATNTTTTLTERWLPGTGWAVVTSPAGGPGYSNLYAVAHSSANDVWAVGDEQSSSSQWLTLIEHWNGSTWSVVPSPNAGPPNDVLAANGLDGVAVVSSSDVWAVGNYFNPTDNATETLIEHWDGSSWTIVPSPNGSVSGTVAPQNVLNAVTAVTASDVWAVGYYGSDAATFTLIEHWNGTTWSIVSSPSPGAGSNNLSGVSGASSTDVWAVGTSATAGGRTLTEHWNGTAWSVVSSPSVSVPPRASTSTSTRTSTGTYSGVAGSGLTGGVTVIASNDVWAVGISWDGKGNTSPLNLHWNDTAWQAATGPALTTSGLSVTAIAAASSSAVWVVGTYYVSGVGANQVYVEQYAPPPQL